MTIRNICIATSIGGLSTPLSLAPARIVEIMPDEVFTASGYRKLLGSEGRELYWDITNAVDWDDLMTRTGGTAASSILGAIQCPEHVSRFSTVPSYGQFLCFLDQPVKGEFRQGPNRYNVMVRARRMVLSVALPI